MTCFFRIEDIWRCCILACVWVGTPSNKQLGLNQEFVLCDGEFSASEFIALFMAQLGHVSTGHLQVHGGAAVAGQCVGLTIWDICFATSAIRWDIVFLELITLHNSDMLFFFSAWFLFFLVRTSDVCGCSPGCAWLNGEHACTICAVRRLLCSVLSSYFYHLGPVLWFVFLIELCAGRCSLIVMRMGKFTIESHLSFVQKWLYFYNDHSCAHKASTDTQNTCQHSPRSQSILNLRFSFLKFASSHQSSMVAGFEPEEIHGLDTPFRSESLLAAR